MRLKELACIGGNLRLRKAGSAVQMQFDFNFRAQPPNKKAQAAFEMIKEITSLLIDARHRQSIIHQKLIDLKGLAFLAKPLNQSMAIAVDHIVDSFHHRVQGSLLSFLVTNYIYHCLPKVHGLEQDAFAIRLVANVTVEADLIHYCKPSAFDRFEKDLRACFEDYRKAHTALNAIVEPLSNLYAHDDFKLQLHSIKADKRHFQIAIVERVEAMRRKNGKLWLDHRLDNPAAHGE